MVVIKEVVMVLLIMALASVPLAFRTTNNHNTPRTWFSSLLAPPSSNLSFSLLSPLLPANSFGRYLQRECLCVLLFTQSLFGAHKSSAKVILLVYPG